MCTKIISFLLVILFVVSIYVAKAQTAGKVHRVGIATLGFFTSGQKEILGQGLRDLGYIEGQNIFYERRFAKGKPDRLADLVGELIGLKVDVIVSNSTEAIKMIPAANRSMPVVMASISDPLG